MDSQFKDKVYNLVSAIPSGRVMTYSQIASLCGHPLAAQAVGQIAHFGPKEIPWHRVVNIRGRMASGFPYGGPNGQMAMLLKEGVNVIDNHIKLNNYLWWPND